MPVSLTGAQGRYHKPTGWAEQRAVLMHNAVSIDCDRQLEQALSSLHLTVMFLWAMCTSFIGGLTGIVVLWNTKMYFSINRTAYTGK